MEKRLILVNSKHLAFTLSNLKERLPNIWPLRVTIGKWIVPCDSICGFYSILFCVTWEYAVSVYMFKKKFGCINDDSVRLQWQVNIQITRIGAKATKEDHFLIDSCYLEISLMSTQNFNIKLGKYCMARIKNILNMHRHCKFIKDYAIILCTLVGVLQ